MKHQKRNTEVTDNFDKNQKKIDENKLIKGLKQTITSLLVGIIASNTLNAKTNDHTPKHDKKMYDSEYIAPTQELGDKKDDTIFNAQSAINNNLNKESGEKPPEDIEEVDGPLKYYKNVTKVHEYMENELKIDNNITTRDKKNLFIAEMILSRCFSNIESDTTTIMTAFVGIYARKLGLDEDQYITVMDTNPEANKLIGTLSQARKGIKDAIQTNPKLQIDFEKNIEHAKFNEMLEGIIITQN